MQFLEGDGMEWPKGQPRPAGAGRQKGSRNKRTEGGEHLAAEIIDDPQYVRNLKERALNGTLPSGLETMLFHYRYGRPAEQRGPDDEAFLADLLDAIWQHVPSAEGRQAIREVVRRHMEGTALRVVV
jgi:hypothetical protein